MPSAQLYPASQEEQAVQELCDAALCFPASHIVRMPSAQLYPASQEEQAESPAREYVVPVQEEHSFLSASGYFPALQTSHLIAIVLALILPLAQLGQVLLPSRD